VWASGTSESTAFLAGVVTQLRQLAPNLTVEQAEQALRTSAQSVFAGPSLDVVRAFGAVGLADALADGHARLPGLTTSGDTMVPIPSALSSGGVPATTTSPGLDAAPPSIVPQVDTPGRARSRLPKPSVRSARLRSAILSFRLTNKPRDVEARVEIYARRRGTAFPRVLRVMHVVGDRVRTRVLGIVSELSITYRDPEKVRDTSVVSIVHPRR
jgi:hypothetical protein